MNDFSFHGLPPRLNQAFDSNRSSGASLWNNPITRRSFLKRSGAATVGTLVLLSPALNTVAEAEILTLQLSDGTSFTRDFSSTVEWFFEVSEEPDDLNEPDVAKEYAFRDNRNPECADEEGWKNKKVTPLSARFPHPINIGTYNLQVPEDGMFQTMMAASRFFATGPNNGRYSEVTFGGRTKGYIFEDGDLLGEHTPKAVASAVVGGATWTIDKNTGTITQPHKDNCVDHEAATVGTGFAKFSVTLGKSGGSIELGCNQVVGGIIWKLLVKATKTAAEAGGEVGGDLNIENFEWEGAALEFKWSVCKLKVTHYTYIGHDGITRSMPDKLERFPISHSERGHAKEDDYAPLP